MKYFPIRLFALLAILGGVAGCQPPQQAVQTPAPEPEKSEIMINLTSDATEDPHSTLMALHLAQHALDADIPATVFANVHGVRLFGEGGESLEFQGENLQELLAKFMEDGGEVLACPHCMEAHEITEADLMEGVQVSNNALMMGKIKGNPSVFTY